MGLSRGVAAPAAGTSAPRGRYPVEGHDGDLRQVLALPFQPAPIWAFNRASAVASRDAEVNERGPEVRVPEIGEVSARVIAAVSGRCLPDGLHDWLGCLVFGKLVLQG